MAKPAEIDIEYTRQDTEPFGFTLKDSDGVALDVSGSTFTFSLNEDPDGDSGTAVLLLTLASSFVTDGTDGKIQFTPITNDMDLDADVYFYDIQQDTPTKRTVAKGKFTILVQITLT